MSSSKGEKKNSHNNNGHKYSHKFGQSPVVTNQINLYGEIIPENIELRGHYRKLLETFYLNSQIAITRKTLFKAWGNELHINTIDNFLKHATSKGWVILLKPIKGAEVNTAYYYQKFPDTLSTGQTVQDHRTKYYQITNHGKEVYENSK